MIHTISNDALTVRISDMGAELQSVKDASGERLWQGDAAYWSERAPFLFPFCGRFWNDLATVDGVPCDPGAHGFFRHFATRAEQVSDREITFVQTETPETLARYPFAYQVKITYAVEGNTLRVTTCVSNTGSRTMPYAFGAHPGFVLPNGNGLTDGHYLQFSSVTSAKNICFDEACCFLTGKREPLQLRDGDKLDLCEHMFEDNGSAFFADVAPAVTLKSDRSERSITVHYEGFPYLGVWKAPGGNFLCIEPWTGLPATVGQSTELYEKPELIRLPAGESRTHTYSVTFA